MRRLIALLVAVIIPTLALAGGTTAPGVVQSGSVTPGDCSQFASNGVVIDSGGTCGTGTAGVIQATGTANQILINGNSATHTGALTFTLPAITILGANSTATGILELSGVTSGTVSIQPQSAAGSWNFNLPITAGSAGGPLLSQGGGSTPMTWGGISGNTTTFGTTSGTLTSGHCIDIDASGNLVDAGAVCGTSTLAFSGLTSGTNTTAAMVLGTGGSLNFTGSGTINASSLGGATFASPGSIGSGSAGSGAFTTLSASSTVSGTGFSTYLASPPGIGGTAPAAGSFTTLSGTSTITFTGLSSGVQSSCLGLNSSNQIVLATGACGISGGGSAFNALTSGTNTTATMVVGTGATLGVSGSGTIGATTLGGATFAAPGPIGSGTASTGAFSTLGATGAVTLTGLTTGTQADCVGLSASNTLVLSSGACGSGGGGSLTVTDGTNSVSSTTTLTLGNGFVVSGSAGSATANLTTPINAQTGTTYPIVATDNAKLVTLSNASSIAATIAQAGTTGFGAGYSTCLTTINTGVVTVTPTTSTILGGSTLLVPKNVGACITSDGTNYDGFIGVPPYPGGTTGFLRADGVWATLVGTSGQITLTVSGTTTTASLPATITQSESFTGNTTLALLNGYLANAIQVSTTACTLGTTSGGCSGAASGDCGTYISFTGANPVVTIPATLPVGCEVAIEQDGSTQVSITGSAVTPATLHSPHSFAGKTAGQYSTIGVTIITNAGGSSAQARMSGDGA